MLHWMMKCADHFGVEITFVLNADTGYVFNLSNELYEEVIITLPLSLPGCILYQWSHGSGGIAH